MINDETEKITTLKVIKYIDTLEKIIYLEKHMHIIDENVHQILHDYMNYSEINGLNIQSGRLYKDWNYDI